MGNCRCTCVGMTGFVVELVKGDKQMEELTDEERAALLDIYSGGDDEPPIPAPVLESLISHGLLVRGEDGTIRPTDRGDFLYEQLTGDEPFEGV